MVAEGSLKTENFDDSARDLFCPGADEEFREKWWEEGEVVDGNKVEGMMHGTTTTGGSR